MAIKSARILIVVNDPNTMRMVGQPSLKKAGYEVLFCSSVDQAVEQAVPFLPHVVILDHDLPGINGRDLMVALKSAGIEAPFVEFMNTDDAESIVQSYRMGARDILLKPFKETELFAILESIMTEVRDKEEKDQLAEQLREANYRLELSAREMQSLIDIQETLRTAKSEFEAVDQILEELLQVTDSSRGWVVLEAYDSNQLTLAACRNMPANVSKELGKPWMDKLTTRIFETGNAWVANEKDLAAAGLEKLGTIVMLHPIQVQNRLIGAVALVKKNKVPYSPSAHQVTQTTAHYLAMFVLTNRLYSGIREREAKIETIREEACEAIKHQLMPLVQDSIIAMSIFSSARQMALGKQERGAVKNVRYALQRMRSILKNGK
ncbi:MAG: response regulator [Anaerolineae bacterium]|jgi:DNA-binding response OmpR family regulator|nr:response regulator [Anaerolineae bacterium]